MYLSKCRPTTLLGGRGQANMEDLTIIIPQVKFPTCMGEDSLFKYPNFLSHHVCGVICVKMTMTMYTRVH